MGVRWQAFNINHRVRVKLTDHGCKVLKQRHEQLWGRRNRTHPYVPPVEDADGWSEWQLWSLMCSFGGHITKASEMLFATDIEFEVPDGNVAVRA